MSPSRVIGVHPSRAIAGGRIVIEGSEFPIHLPAMPEVRVGGVRARVVYASPSAIAVLTPGGLESGPAAVRVEGTSGESSVEVIAPFASGLHQVDNPALDGDGNLYVTYSGSRGQQVPVSIFRVRPNGARETFSTGIVNPTSMTFDTEGRLYVSSRFEGTVYRVLPDGAYEPFATDLGVACGLAFGPDGWLFVGDRTGTIFRVDRQGRAESFASLPPSVAAFHLAMGPDEALYVTAPTLSSYDSVYRIDARGRVTTHYTGFGRPQGLAFDSSGTLFVIDALAGASGLYRLPSDGEPDLAVAGPGLVGVVFDHLGGLVLCSGDTAYRLVGR